MRLTCKQTQKVVNLFAAYIERNFAPSFKIEIKLGLFCWKMSNKQERQRSAKVEKRNEAEYKIICNKEEKWRRGDTHSSRDIYSSGREREKGRAYIGRNGCK